MLTRPGLESERDQIRERQRFLGRMLTEENKPGRQKPMTCKKYFLRGIASSTNVVYVCRRTPKASQDLIEFDDGTAPVDQWWRLAYDEGQANPVSTTVW